MVFANRIELVGAGNVGGGMKLLSSPRMRRRIAWGSAAGAAAGAVVLGVALLPDHSSSIERETASPPAARQPVAAVPSEPRTVRLTPAVKREVTDALDRFILAGVAGRHPASAWDLTTDALHAGSTRSDWAKGSVPFWRFAAAGTHFSGWVLKYSYPGDVGLDIFLQPKRGASTGPISFRAELKRVDGRWLVEAWQPMAMFSKPHEKAKVLAQPDLAPGISGGGEQRISANWLFAPLGFLAGMIVLIPLAVGVSSWRKNRAVTRYLQDERRREGRTA
jgi:hypothetical protein